MEARSVDMKMLQVQTLSHPWDLHKVENSHIPKLYFTLFTHNSSTAAEENHENKHFHRFARRGLDIFPSHIVKGQGTFEFVYVVWSDLAFSKPD